MFQIERLADDAPPHVLGAIERIFFAASGRKGVEQDSARAAYYERWLGRYLLHDRAHAFVARTQEGAIAGYLVGCLEDPATAERFDDISYFQDFADLSARYPAHLHINLDDAWRGQGLGGRLVAHFLAHAVQHGARGVHIVTGARARNISFYARQGFAPLREIAWSGAQVLFMGKELVGSDRQSRSSQ